MNLLGKGSIEASLQEEQQMIQAGTLKEDNPVDTSDRFWRLCEACRRGNLKECQEMISEGANINARDEFDYTPLILASLCGHYEVVQLLLEAGALCERDTFQGERCLYNALNNRIRELLLSYDYSKSTDPLQAFAAHMTSLLTSDIPQMSDILVVSADKSYRLHKFILSARSPFFSKKLAAAPETSLWKLAPKVPPQAFEIAIKYLYLGEIPNDVGGGPGTGFTEDEVLDGLDKLTKHLEIRNLWDSILEAGDRRLMRQRRSDELERGRNQFQTWYFANIMKHKFYIKKSRASSAKWDRNNAIFADVLLQADEPEDFRYLDESDDENVSGNESSAETTQRIPIGPVGQASRSPSRHRQPRISMLWPVHKAMLIRSEYFAKMFSSGFREAQNTEYLQVIQTDCSPNVLQTVLFFLYTDKVSFDLGLGVDVLFAAEMLLMDRLKTKAAGLISTLGSASLSQIPSRLGQNVVSKTPKSQEDELDPYDVIRSGWLLHVRRLEEFGAKYMAHRLELYIDEPEFEDLIRESASRIKDRQETDTIELLDDIRHYLSERFRMRFEDANIDEMENEVTEASEGARTSDAGAQEQQPMASVETDHDPRTAAAAGSESPSPMDLLENGAFRTLDGELASDEMEQDAMNYQILLDKIDGLLERLKLDA